MTTKHANLIYFEGKREMAKKRLQKLVGEGLISAKRDKLYEPSKIQLTLKGFRYLNQEGLLFEYPKISEAKFKSRNQVSPLNLKHELEVVDSKSAIIKAISEIDNLSVDEFTTYPELSKFSVQERRKPKPTTIKPDGFCRIHELEADNSKSEHTFFLEIDRGTETLNTLLGKAVCYNLYYRTGGYAEKRGADTSQYRDYPFRVIMIMKSKRRIENVREKLKQNTPPIHSQVILLDTESFLENPLQFLE